MGGLRMHSQQKGRADSLPLLQAARTGLGKHTEGQQLWLGCERGPRMKPKDSGEAYPGGLYRAERIDAAVHCRRVSAAESLSALPGFRRI
jgi:hypothetical protein